MSVLSVGHGLCTVIGSSDETFVFDCGEHRVRGIVPLSWKRLVDRTVPGDEITSMAVSHLHFDHYCGFLTPIPNVCSNVKFYIGRMPIVDKYPNLGTEFAFRLMTIAPLDPQYGPLDLDLTYRVRRYAPSLQPIPVSQDDDFCAGGEHWTVLWPPRVLRPSDWYVQCVEDAIAAYDKAAERHPWLAERLKCMRASDSYETLLDNLKEDRDPVDVRSSSIRREESAERKKPDDEPLLTKAGRLLRHAANHLSLILRSDNGILLTGDATRSAMRHALKSCYGRYSVIITPHHGGEGYVPYAIKNKKVHSDVWVSSAGDQYSSNVSAIYSTLSGEHFRTDHDGDVEILLDRGSGYCVASRYKSWFVR